MSSEQESQLQNLADWMDEAANRGAIAVLTHKNGDMDTVGSAIALAASCSSAMACGVHLSRLSSRMVEKFSAPFMRLDAEAPRWPKSLSGIVVVDAAAPDQVGLELPKDVPLCIIDHHSTNDWDAGEGGLNVTWDVSSTTQIIHDYLHEFHLSSMSNEVVSLLLAGLITDTGRFKHADLSSFESACKLIAEGTLDYAAFIEELEQDDLTRSDKGAIAKSLSRTVGMDAGPWWLLKSTAGTQESVVCRALMSAGADVAMVLRRRDGVTRMTVRANRSSVLHGLRLGKMMEQLSISHGGEGGGHDGAAGWTSGLDTIAAESAFIHLLSGTVRR